MTNKKLFKIVIEETVSDEFEVYADNLDDAVQIAKSNYSKGKFVLSPGNISNKKLAVIDMDNNSEYEWSDF